MSPANLASSKAREGARHGHRPGTRMAVFIRLQAGSHETADSRDFTPCPRALTQRQVASSRKLVSRIKVSGATARRGFVRLAPAARGEVVTPRRMATCVPFLKARG